MTEPTSHPEPRHRLRSLAAAAALYAGLTLLLTSRVLAPADEPGDPSFQQALGYFMTEGMQAGQDYIFTYGPLGHFLIPRYQPGLFWIDYLVGLAMGLAAAWPVFAVLRSGSFTGLERAATAVAFLLSAYTGPGPETPYLMAAVLMVALVRRGAVTHPLAVGGLALGLAFLSLAKFTLMVVSVGFVGYIALFAATARRYGLIAVVAGAYAVGLLLFWFAAGQDWGNFPRFLADSIEISRAYNAGMVLEGSLAARLLGVVALSAALAATLSFLPFERNRLQMAFDAVLVLVLAFILWKSGMVRQNGHEVKLFLPAMLLPLLVQAPDLPSPLAMGLRKGAATIALAAGAVGHAIAAQPGPMAVVTAPVTEPAMAAYQTVLPWVRLNALEDRWEELGILEAWPETREQVGDETVDMFPPEQRLLLISGFNYRPRYVFQGYQACTPRLLDLNGASYWGDGPAPPPRFVVYRNMPIDHRFPYMEDSQALLALFYNYSPVLLEYGLVLFERNAEPLERLPEPVPVAEGMLGPDEQLDVPETPGQWQLLALEFPESDAPWLLRRGKTFRMTVEYADGRSAEYRVLPGLASRPFLLNRFWASGPLRENNDYREDRVVRLRLAGPDTDWSARYRLTAIEPPASATVN